GSVRIGERVQPYVDPLGEVAERPTDRLPQRPGDERSTEEEQKTDDEPTGPFGGDVERHDEHAEVHERRAEILLEHQNHQAEQPDEEHRAEVASAREVDAEDPFARQGKYLALADQVVREEGEQSQLRELAGLDGEATDEDPQLRPIDH